MFLLTISMWDCVRLHLTQITMDIRNRHTAASVEEFCVAIWCVSHGHYFG